MKKCSQCGEVKEAEEFGWARGSDKKPGVRRAKCRPCYNSRRREHYNTPEVNAIKLEKRKAEAARPEVKARRKAYAALPENRAREAEARKKYKSQPAVQEAIRKKKAENHQKASFRASTLMISVGMRCRKGNLPMEIDAAWAQAILENGVCQVSGIPFDFGKHPSTRRNPFGPSVDQIVAGKGYTLENSRIVLTALNLALCEWGVDTYVQIAQEVLRANGFSVAKAETASEQSLQLPPN